jgi:tetratricopeptide (TPR) repeat protein
MAGRTTQAYDTFVALLRRRRFADALSVAEREALNAGSRPSFWHTQCAIALNRMKRFGAARESADKALRAAPTDSYALLAMAEALVGEGRVDEAVSTYEQVALSSDPRAAGRARSGLIECAMRLKEWERVLSLVSSENMRPSDAHAYRARALRAMGRNEEALTACRAWLAEQPDYPPALWLQTDIEIELEGLESVRTRLGRLARIPSRPPIYGEIYASLCRRAGVTDAALGQYEKLQARTGGTRMMRKKLFALAKTDRAHEALPLIEELLRTTPHDHYLHSSYAGACRRTGSHARAVAFFRDLLERHPTERHLYGRIKGMEKARRADEVSDDKT